MLDRQRTGCVARIVLATWTSRALGICGREKTMTEPGGTKRRGWCAKHRMITILCPCAKLKPKPKPPIPRAALSLARFIQNHRWCNVEVGVSHLECIAHQKLWHLPASWRAKGGGRG